MVISFKRELGEIELLVSLMECPSLAILAANCEGLYSSNEMF